MTGWEALCFDSKSAAAGYCRLRSRSRKFLGSTGGYGRSHVVVVASTCDASFDGDFGTKSRYQESAHAPLLMPCSLHIF